MAVSLRQLAIWMCVACVALCASLPARATGDFGNSGKFVGWWELGGFYGTDDSSRGEIVLFTPLMQSATTLFFLDARGKLFEEDVQEANLALGYRQMMASGWNLGLWAGWDVRDTEIDNTFHQVSFGLEALSERFDLRVNGYVPVTDPKGSPSTAEVVLQGNNIFLIGGEEVALYGIDGEVGMLLFGGTRGGGGLKGAPAPARRHELRGYVGGFWFDDDDAIEEVAGPKGRLEYRINDIVSSLPGSRLTIESQLSYDEVRDTKFEIGARLRIPFGARGSDAALRTASLNAQELRMIEGLERDTDIITVRSKEENVIDDATDVALTSVSFAKNANQFANAVDAGGNRLIILQRNGAQIDVSATDGQQLKNNQTVQGGASTILVRGAKSGVVAPFTAPGKRPTLFTDDVNPLTGAITMASNTHLAGVNIRGVGDTTTQVDGNNGITVDSASNVVIEQTDIRRMGEDAIRLFENNSDVRIYHADISNIFDDGIELDGGNSDITLKHIAISDTGVDGRGVTIRRDNRNITVEDATIRRTGQIGLSTLGSTNVTFRDITIAGGNDNGIFLDNDNRNVTIENATITDRVFGISFDGGNRNVTIRNVRIDNTTANGIEGDEDTRNVTFEDVTITNAGGPGINFTDNNRNFTFRNINIDNVGGQGITFGDNNSNITIRDVDIRDATFQGIGFDNNNSNVTIRNSSIAGTVNFGIVFNNNNSNVTIRNSSIAGTVNFGIVFDNNNSNVTVSGNTISNVAADGILFNGGNSATITGNTLTDIDGEAIDVGGALANTLTITDNTFAGTIGGSVVEFDGVVDTLLDGSGNQLAPGVVVVGSLCELGGAAGFVGTLEIGNQTFVNGVGCT